MKVQQSIPFKVESIAVVGLGYVGLPLAIALAKCYKVVGFDVNEARINALQDGIDDTLEVDKSVLEATTGLSFSHRASDIRNCNVYIVTVPTPVDQSKKPDFTFITNANDIIAKILKPNDTVVYESTVYPGATEEICVPQLARLSNLTYNRDFFVGYSPERINPGDTKHKFNTIQKVVSGSTAEATDFIDSIYSKVVDAGTHKCSSIQVAEAAKVIENTQRDVNIALINELAVLFNRLDIDVYEVLEAAGTKWNFLPFSPGLVGGHCIGVDPYYLTHKAQTIGFHPEMILAGRRINDSMGSYVASRLVKALSSAGVCPNKAKVLVMGFTFKEDCPDIRNTKVIDIIAELSDYKVNTEIYDPLVPATKIADKHQVKCVSEPLLQYYDAVVIAVKHSQFRNMGLDRIRSFSNTGIVFDIKCMFGIRDDTLRL